MCVLAYQSVPKSGEERLENGKFMKGHSLGGRPKGSKTQRTLDILPVKELAAQLLQNEPYIISLMSRLRNGEAPHMEKFFAEHLWGKPKEHISISLTEVHLLAVRTMSDLELSAFLAALDAQQPEEALKLLPGGKVA